MENLIKEIETLIETLNSTHEVKYQLVNTIKVKKVGRKEQILNLIKENDNKVSMKFLADELQISNRNVSSQLSYLRKDELNIISYKVGNETIIELRDDE